MLKVIILFSVMSRKFLTSYRSLTAQRLMRMSWHFLIMSVSGKESYAAMSLWCCLIGHHAMRWRPLSRDTKVSSKTFPNTRYWISLVLTMNGNIRILILSRAGYPNVRTAARKRWPSPSSVCWQARRCPNGTPCSILKRLHPPRNTIRLSSVCRIHIREPIRRKQVRLPSGTWSHRPFLWTLTPIGCSSFRSFALISTIWTQKPTAIAIFWNA